MYVLLNRFDNKLPYVRICAESFVREEHIEPDARLIKVNCVFTTYIYVCK